MVTLKIDEHPNDPKIISSSKKSLLRSFKITSYKHIDRAVWLALYLYLSGRESQAQSLLDSFVFEIQSSENCIDLWSSNGMGILLLAYIYGKAGNKEREAELVNVIINDDIMTDRATRGELLREEFEYHEERMEWYPNETHKYRCEILGERFFMFLYFLELIPTFRHEISDEDVSLINEILDDVRAKLVSEIGES